MKVKEITIPAAKIPSAKETDNALAVLTKMSKTNIQVMPVIKNKKLVGAVSVASLLRFVRLNLEVS
jgi:predicted transcriptional regulator